jgi:starch phosphorylase
VEDVQVLDQLEKRVGEGIAVRVRLRMGELLPEDITVEAYYGGLDQNGEFVERDTTELEAVEPYPNGYVFQGTIPCKRTGRFGFTVRVTPSAKRLENRFTLALVTWA